MSNLKFDKSLCGNIISELEAIDSLLESSVSELTRYYTNLPNSSEIKAKAKELAYESDKDNEALVEENYNYYMNNFGNTLINARTNLVRMRAATSVVQSNVGSVNKKVSDIELAVEEYEEQNVMDNDEKTNLYIPPEVPVALSGAGSANGSRDQKGEIVPNVNVDTNGDGKPDLNVDIDGDGVPDVNVDTDGDGKPNLNIDTNGDGVPDVNIDTNGDGKPDLNIDTNGDNVPNVNVDTNNDGKPDLNIDTNGDLVPDVNIDTNGDGKPDLNIDTNGKRVPNVNVDTNGDGKPDLNIDTDGDLVPDVNVDTNGDGKPDLNIDTNGNGHSDTNIDINGDGKPDINVDTDGDGEPDKNVIPGYEHGVGNDGTYIEDLIKRMKLMVDDDGNIMCYDEDGNIIYPFLEDGVFVNPANAQKFKLSENAFLEMLDGPEKGDAVDSLDLDLDKNVSSAGLAVGGMVAVGAAAANAAATMKRTKDEINDGLRTYDYDYDDDAKLTPEQYKKRKTGTIISIVLLTLLILCNEIALIASITTDVTIVLLGLAIAITAIITSMGLKIGKFYTLCATLVNLLLVFILTSTGATSSLGYIIAFAVIIVVLLYYYFTKIFERILPMFNYVPAVVGIVCIGFVGLLSALAITPWWLNLILVVLIIVGYFAYNYFGIAQLEEQMESEKKKSLSIYDYVDLKTNKKQWKSAEKGDINQKITYNVGETKNKTYFNKVDSNHDKNELQDFIDSLEKKDK